jgi:hypothetical protein
MNLKPVACTGAPLLPPNCQISVAECWQEDNIPNCVNGPCFKAKREFTCDQSGRREKRIWMRRKPRAPSGKKNILQDFTEENV